MSKNPIDIGAKIFKILEELFGKAFARSIVGTESNVVKPPRFDANAPTGNVYSKGALEKNPGALTLAEDKIKQYAPSVLATKNVMQQANFLENAQNVLNVKKGKGEIKTKDVQMDTTKEAEVIELGSGKKLDEEGIAVLKDKRGYPEGVEPGSTMAKAIDEMNAIKQGDDETLKKAVDTFFGMGKDTIMEGKRRAVIRKILLKDNRINLTKDEFESLSNYNDLRGGGDTKMDPLELFNKYYVRDINKLESLDAVIDVAKNEREAAEAFLKDEAFDVKPVRESLDDEAVEISETSELPDPEDLASGGRVGFKSGSVGKGIKSIIKMMSEKFGKDAVKTADQVVVPDEVLSKTQRELQELDELRELYDNPMEFVKTVTPKFYERMELKIKYPGITDELIEKIMADDNPQRKAEVLATMDEAFKMMEKGMSSDAILNAFKKTPRTKNAGGGLNYLMGM